MVSGPYVCLLHVLTVLPIPSKHHRLLSMKKVMVELRDSAWVSFLESVDSGLHHGLASGLCVMRGGGRGVGLGVNPGGNGSQISDPDAPALLLLEGKDEQNRPSAFSPPPSYLVWSTVKARHRCKYSEKGNKFCKPLVKQVCIMQPFSESHSLLLHYDHPTSFLW